MTWSIARAWRRSRLAHLFEGTGLYAAAGIFFGVIGMILFLVTLLSTVGLLWIGHPVTGAEQNGIIYYRYGGTSYSMNDPGSQRTRARVTVYVDGSDPSRAEINSTTARVSAALFGVGPIAVGVGFLAAGLLKKRRDQHRHDDAILHGETFGQGLDPETVERILEQRRAEAQTVPRPRPPD